MSYPGLTRFQKFHSRNANFCEPSDLRYRLIAHQLAPCKLPFAGINLSMLQTCFMQLNANIEIVKTHAQGRSGQIFRLTPIGANLGESILAVRLLIQICILSIRRQYAEIFLAKKKHRSYKAVLFLLISLKLIPSASRALALWPAYFDSDPSCIRLSWKRIWCTGLRSKFRALTYRISP